MNGYLSKMETALLAGKVHYTLALSTPVVMNDLLGQKIRLHFTGQMQCVGCGRAIQKTFQQGYCFPCVRSKAACDLCIVKPERCHFHLGTCREPEWGEAHCMKTHIVYLANTSGLKVGITRFSNVPQRFIDQGAVQALPLFEVDTRLQSGQVEIAIAQYLEDKTNWRKMLQGKPDALDLFSEKEKVLKILAMDLRLSNIGLITLDYPIQTYPTKISSLNFDKTPVIEGILEGIKGQYLILSTGVLNIRNFSGYQIELTVG
jgi:hypothetical protein